MKDFKQHIYKLEIEITRPLIFKGCYVVNNVENLGLYVDFIPCRSHVRFLIRLSLPSLIKNLHN